MKAWPCFFVGVLAACSDDGVEENDAALCARVCEDVVAAGCSLVPLEQSECETNCNEMRAGPCREDHNALLSCGGDEPTYVCNPDDSMTVAGCEAEYDSLTACLNEP